MRSAQARHNQILETRFAFFSVRNAFPGSIPTPRSNREAREQLVALRDVTTAEIATELIGVLNNPLWVYEKGARTLDVDGQIHLLKSLEGTAIENDKTSEITVDGVMQIRGGKPLRIRYQSATRPERARVTDLLYLNVVDGERAWN